MAKRQTDVNINYRVNTVDIERGNGLLARASKATDDLRKATQTFGTQGAQAYKFQSRAIEGMEIEVARLKQIVKLANTQNAAEVAKVTSQYRSAKAQLDAYNKSLLQTNAAQKQASISAQGIATGLGQVYSAIRLVIAAGLARELVNMSLSAATLSGTIEGVSVAFHKLPNSTLLLEDLRRATHGTVTDLELMQKALRANNFRIPLEKMGTLLEFATVKAQQTGQEVNHLVEYIVSGIGYRSIKRLDDLGFTLNRVKGALGDVSLQSASTGQVMDAVTKLMNEDLKETGGFVETSATQVGVLARKWNDLKVIVSEFATSPALLNFYNKFLTNLTAGFQFIVGGTKRVQEEVAKVNAIKEVEDFKEMQMTEQILKNKELAVLTVKHESDIREGMIFRNKDELRQLEERQKYIDGIFNGEVSIKKEVEKNGGSLKQFLEDLRTEEARIKEQIPFYKNKNIMLAESVRILKEYMASLKLSRMDEPGEDDGDGKRGFLMKDLTQVVDIRFKDPKTGAITKEHNDKVLNDFMMSAQKVIDSIGPFHIEITPIVKMSEWEKAFEANRDAIKESAAGIIQDQVDSVLQADVDSYQARIDAAHDFYDKQIELAGDNERAKEQLRLKEDKTIKKLEKEKADREKKAAKAGIVVSTALGIMKVFAGEGTFADKIIKALIVAAQGASQLVVADRARYYAKGAIDIQGPGTKTSDSIPARLSRGESVMTAEETLSSKGIFKAVRARKLNDKVLKDIVSGRSGGAAAHIFDDSKIVKELRDLKNAQPDLVERGNLIYENRRKGDNYRQIVRSKSFRK